MSLGIAFLTYMALVSTGLASNPFLLYSPGTGNVDLHPNGVNILAFNLQSNNQFIPPANFNDLLPLIDAPALIDNLPDAIGWVGPIAAGGNGFGDRPEDVFADLGHIFPTGLERAGLDGLLTNNAWAGPGGTSGAFDLILRGE